MAHYFTNENIVSNEKNTSCIIRNHKFEFITDNGVFSKKRLDFGTRSLLENIDLDNIKGDVLDFGCGYGAIGIFIAKVKNIVPDMIDINLRALDLVTKNSKLNKVEVNAFESNIYSNVSKKYDFIITNPPIRVGNEILYEILIGAKEHLKKDGELWFVINKNQGAKTVIKRLSDHYVLETVKKNKGFYIIKAKPIDKS